MTYPRPLLRRAHWQTLDGPWSLAFSGSSDPQQVTFDRQIMLPYAPESPRSGVNELGNHPVGWDQPTITRGAKQPPRPGERLLLQ